ncbi:MAG: hypothetical protein R2867_19180 [Caldilineaceae bacterium]
MGGWVVAQPNLAALDMGAWLGITAVTLVTIGFYPITQIYQIDEDLARGDCTFAAWIGPSWTFRFAIVVQALAALLLTLVIYNLWGLAVDCGSAILQCVVGGNDSLGVSF